MEDIEAYLSQFTGQTRARLEQIRDIITTSTPVSTEVMNYGIPTFKHNGKNLIHYAGYAKHVAIYPGPATIERFSEELKPYKTSKGTIQFPHDQPLPLDLITQIAIDATKR